MKKVDQLIPNWNCIAFFCPSIIFEHSGTPPFFVAIVGTLPLIVFTGRRSLVSESKSPNYALGTQTHFYLRFQTNRMSSIRFFPLLNRWSILWLIDPCNGSVPGNNPWLHEIAYEFSNFSPSSRLSMKRSRIDDTMFPPLGFSAFPPTKGVIN